MLSLALSILSAGQGVLKDLGLQLFEEPHVDEPVADRCGLCLNVNKVRKDGDGYGRLHPVVLTIEFFNYFFCSASVYVSLVL